MQPKRFTTQRFRFLFITGLLCAIGVGISQYSPTKYNIPFIGWILAVREYRNANAAYWQATDEGLQRWQEYYAAQAAYDHTRIGSLSTLAFLAFCLILINWLCRRTQLTLKGHPPTSCPDLNFREGEHQDT
jgi:hypothetical protein